MPEGAGGAAAAAGNGGSREISSALAADTGVLCLTMMLHFLKLPADPEQIRHEYSPNGAPLDVMSLVRAARQLEVKARAVRVKPKRLEKSPFPAIAEAGDGTFFILARIAEGKALVHVPGQRPETITVDELLQRGTGQFIFLTRRAQLAGEDRRFDFTWFIPSIVKYRRLFGEVLLASLFLQLFGLVTPLFFQVVIDKVLVHRGLTTLDVLVVGLLAITVFEIILGGLRTYIFSHTASRVDVELGARLFRHLLALPIAYFGARQVGQTVARVRELESIRSFLTGNALTVVLDLLFTFVFFAVMYYYAPVLTWIVLGSIPFYVILSVAITPELRRRVEEKFQRGAVNQAFLVESVSGVETLKAMAVEPQMRQRWEEQLAEYVRASFRSVVLGMIGSQGVTLINKVVIAAVLWVGAKLVINGELTVGQLIAFNMLSGQVNQPILRLAQLWQDFQQFRISLDRLGDVLNAPAEPAQSPNRPALPAIKGDIIFDRTVFRYTPEGPEVLRGISLDIKAGQVIGVVGRSGSGKSTLTKLIQRLYVPESGRVLVDGTDLAMVDPTWLRRQVGVVLQENVLFNRSVRDNIALADPAISMEQVIEAAELAGAHEFILELAEGYDTILGERGSSLSGGQRQRIAIARALVTNPRVLIFDEATSALDYESERIIQDNMRSICAGRTVIIVAHRLSTVRRADRIVTIEAGQVVEDGTHEELLRSDGRYAALYKHQTGEL
ncbi:type I secretion system permease/ATPase [Denitrobaculum tricleocarpae]|uniref:Type I secretion system permease/ATPase n=1 Tax=Denitrobaculum tricleocarpae TaxID=2591009 RepID=A0A545TN66_9PROT|nr:type I secretion system permease/ATPase [Denitrobaculum tricleocarpae]TQV78591.1 type I secretion system permease/ATPase [Denitrobaculum tricleocarpae]